MATTQGPNRKAAEKTIRSMESAGLLEPIDAIRIETLRSLATMLDQQPENASLWREYRAAEQSIRSATTHEPDEFASLLADLSAEVGNTKKPSKS
jgi:hypothetical protein